MINKKNVLGKKPHALGLKDAVHVAIVSVRACCPIALGSRCGINEDREAYPDEDGCGVADPWRKEPIRTGDSFWLALDQDAVPNVKHVWEHPEIDFTPPTKAVEYDYNIMEAAKNLKVTYNQIMEAAQHVIDTDTSLEYPGKLTEEELEAMLEDFDRYGFWDSWASEVGYEFENMGSACCPEYEYPRTPLFEKQE